MPLSEKALLHDSEWNCVPMKEVYLDPSFNCRGHIVAADITELVKDVAEKGLIQPITVRKLWETEKALLDKGFKYYLVSGFRRFTSYKVLEAEKIPTHIRDIQSEFDARDVNAVENLQRLDLTLYQEAFSIKHYWMAEWTREEIAERINKSPGWVQTRIWLLEMQPEIQQAAHQGYLLSSDIRALSQFKGDDRLKRAGVMRDARKKGEKAVTLKMKRKEKGSSKRTRNKNEVEGLMNELREHFKKVNRDQTFELKVFVSSQGTMLPLHRICAWVCGEITSTDLHMSLREFFRTLGHDYEIPDFEPEHVY